MARRKTSGKIFIVTGRSQSGKSHAVNAMLAGKKCVLVYDPKALTSDYPSITRVDTVGGLVGHVQKGITRVRVLDPSREKFDLWCRTVFEIVKRVPGEWWLVADELSSVTSPAKAPNGWHVVCSQIKGYGANVIAITQRPAESDKTCFGNADVFLAFHSPRKKDRQYMAEEMDISPDMIANLPAYHHVKKEHGRAAVVVPPSKNP